MPEPTEYATEKEWMSACVPVRIEEGDEQDQAEAVCIGMWGKKGEPDFILSLDNVRAAKAGSRHSATDHKHLQQAIEEIIKAGGDHPGLHAPTNYTKEVVEMKALVDNTDTVILTGIPWGAIKAASDMTLEVLGIPFGGPNQGKDAQGQYFSPRTKTYLDAGKSVPVFYYHGYDDKGKPQGDPVLIGSAKFERTDKQGHWFSVVLDKTKELARKVWEAASKGLAKASSGAVSHLVRLAKDGEILNWVIGELSVFDTYNGKEPANAYAVALPVMKSLYQSAGIEFNVTLPDDETTGNDTGAVLVLPVVSAKSVPATNPQGKITTGGNDMDEKDVTKLVADALKADNDARKAAEDAAKARQSEIDAAVKAEVEKQMQEAVKSRRLPGGGIEMPHMAKFAETQKYDGLTAADASILVATLRSAGKPVSNAAWRATAIKLAEDKSLVGAVSRQSMKAFGIDPEKALKADEIDYSTEQYYGDEWVGIGYSQSLWESIRDNTFVLNKLPQIEVPQGNESIYLPIESTDPTWYKVAEATTSATGYAGPTPTVTASTFGTGRVQMTLAKLGARVFWTGELDEGSLIPFAAQLRSQLAVSGAEYLESAIIDGDVSTTSATNINTIEGAITATDWYLVWDGFRKSPLVTTAANSRSAAGSLDIRDYLETVKLMGTGGKNARNKAKVSFIVDGPTDYKTLMLPEVLTRDVFASPTIEGGSLKSLFGYEYNVSTQMCRHSTVNLSEATGMCDGTTPGDNVYGSILAVRWDQWKFGWRRRMTMESTRWAASDTTEIVAMLRAGLIQRDTEASAISYYVGV
jgi:hypothetical protein